VDNLSSVADRLARAMGRHMTREESDVLPVLMRSLCAAEQRHMVWRLLRAMPLRLLERVMPWVAGKLREEDVKEWLANMRRAAPPAEAPLVGLLSQWARRGGQALRAWARGGRSRREGRGVDMEADAPLDKQSKLPWRRLNGSID
jgi:zinc finger-like protein